MDYRVTSAVVGRYRDSCLAGLSTCILSSFLICLGLATCGCSSAIELSSAWTDRQVIVDGSDAEWQDAMTYVKGSNLALGVRNDRDHLYVCLVMMDRQMQMQMMALGFTVWFDPEGETNRVFGIHYPLGMEGQQPPSALEGRGDPEEAQKLMEGSQRELEIIGPGEKEHERMLLMQAQGIKVKLGNHQGFLVYELSVPLRRSVDHPYAIGVDTNRTVGIGFETTEPNFDKMKGQFGGAGGGGMGGPPRGSGGMPPGGGGPPGPPGMGPPGGEQARPLKLWTQVHLALGNTSTAK